MKTTVISVNGFANLIVLIGMLLMAISLPVVTKLAQQNQENRSNAATKTKTTCFCYVGSSQGVKVTGGSTSSLSSCKSKCTAGACKCTTTTTATTVTSPAKVTCSYTYSPWSPSTCPSSGKQTRNVTGKSPDGCNKGSPTTSQTCTYVAPAKATEDTINTASDAGTGSACTVNSDCASGICDSSTKKCVKKTVVDGNSCNVASDCTSGYCNLTTKRCETKKANGEACTVKTMCSSNYCNLTTKKCEVKKNINSFSCTDMGGTCELKCSKKQYIRYAYGTNSKEIGIINNSCPDSQVCCINKNTDTGCVDGSIDCRSTDKYDYSYALFMCSDNTMVDTGKKCLVSGDKIFYGTNIPDGWFSNRDEDKPEIKPGMDLTQYQKELMARINAAGGMRTRAGVAAAALYLAKEFPYAIPYHSDDGLTTDPNQITSPGFQLIIRRDSTFTYTSNWGTTVTADEEGRTLAGLNCVGFVEWAYRAAGYDVGLKGSTEDVRSYEKNNNSLMASNSSQQQDKLATIKIGDFVYQDNSTGGKHVAIITDIDYASGVVQIAQSSAVGVNIEYIDIFTLKNLTETGSKNSFDSYTHIDDSYFEQKPDLVEIK